MGSTLSTELGEPNSTVSGLSKSVQPTIQFRPGLAANVLGQSDPLLLPYFAPPVHEINISQSTNRY